MKTYFPVFLSIGLRKHKYLFSLRLIEIFSLSLDKLQISYNALGIKIKRVYFVLLSFFCNFVAKY